MTNPLVEHAELIIGLALLIIPVLLYVILILWRRIKRIEAEREASSQRREKQTKDIAGSIDMLCRSMLDAQVELSEGCMRVKILLDHYDSKLHEDPQFKIFSDIYELLEDMPRFEARKNVDKRFLEALDSRRAAIEERNRDQIRKASGLMIRQLSSASANGA